MSSDGLPPDRPRDWRDRWSDDGDPTEAYRPVGRGGAGGDGDSGDPDVTERYDVGGYPAEGDGYGYGALDPESLPDSFADARDPVADFFAAHRAQIREQEADDLTWQRIRRGGAVAGTSRRRAWLAGAGVAASAAVLGIVLTQAFKGGDDDPQPAPPPTISASLDPAVTESPDETSVEPTGEQTGQQSAPAPTTDDSSQAPTTDQAAPAPTSGPTEEESAAEPTGQDGGPATQEPPTQPTAEEPTEPPLLAVGGGVAPAVGSGDKQASVVTEPCPDRPGGECVTLYLSEDGGATWGDPVDLSALGLHGFDRVDDTLLAWGQAGLMRSEDRGRTWTDIPHRGEVVLQVTSWSDRMITVTGSGCSAADGELTCQEAEAAVLDPDTGDLTGGEATALGAVTGPVAGPVEVSRRTQDAFYFGVATPDAGATYWRIPVGGEPGSSFTATDVCGTGEGTTSSLAALARTADGLVLGCQAADGGPGTADQVELHRSADGGQTWSPLATPQLTAPGLCGIASADGTDVVLAARDGVWVSHDAGETFDRTLTHPEGSQGCRLSDPRYGAGTTYVARAGNPGGQPPSAYYRSHDLGDTWYYVAVP